MQSETLPGITTVEEGCPSMNEVFTVLTAGNTISADSPSHSWTNLQIVSRQHLSPEATEMTCWHKQRRIHTRP